MIRGPLPVLLAFACVVMTGCFHGWLNPRSGKGEVVEAEGWAPIDSRGPLETRQRALAEAQKRAVEKSAGVALSATTKVESSVTSEQRIVANVGGYVLNYEILSEKRDEGFLKIRIRAHVLLSLEDGCDQIVAGVSRALPDGRLKIAISRFSYFDGRSSDGPRVVQEALTTRLAGRSAFQVVDTAAVGHVDALVLGQGGLLDSRSAAELARAFDIDAVLTGRLADLPHGRVQIMARLVRIPDGVILAAVDGSIKRTWEDSLAPTGPASVGEWIDRLLSPPAAAFHRTEDISKAMRDGMESLKGPAASRPPPNPEAVRRAPAVSGSALAGPERVMLTRGRLLYERDCAHCHGIEGTGSPTVAGMFGVSPATLNISRGSMKECSSESLARDLKGGKGAMPEIQEALSREDVCALLEYLRSFRE